MAWLLEQGVTREDVAWANLLAGNRVSIGKRSGQCLELTYEEGAVRACAREEWGERVGKQGNSPARTGAGHQAAH